MRKVPLFKKEIKVLQKKKKTKNISGIKNRLDIIFARYIRERDNNTCVICGSNSNPNNGHFISRVCLALRFDEVNCHCQCARCNCIHELNPIPYTNFMIKKYGEGMVQILNSMYFGKPWKLKYEWYEEEIKKYEEKLDNL